MIKLSIIIPFFNEKENLPLLRERLEKVLATLPEVQGEVVLVDDHSSDGSSAVAREWVSTSPHARYIRLSRNCGSHAAVSAGLAHCTGDCAALIAADLQDPPETIPDMIEKWQEGYDVVWAVRMAREGETWFKKFSANTYYRLMRRYAIAEMPSKGADFLFVDRKIIDAYNDISEKNSSLLAMILWMGFKQTFIGYVKQARYAGSTKWNLPKKIKLFIDSIVSFSYAPIRLMSALGLIMACCGFLYAIVVVTGWFCGWVVAGTGYAALMTVLLVGQGLILTMLGVLGEYLWRAYDEARGRPQYIIEEHVASTNSGHEPESGQRRLRQDADKPQTVGTQPES